MNISILSMISGFAQKHELTIRNIYYKFNENMPSALYDTVINYFKSALTFYVDDPKIDGFHIELTNDYDVLFCFLGNNGKTKLIVKEDGKFFENLHSAKIVSESQFLNSIKILDEKKNQEIINNLPLEFKNRFLKNDNQVTSIEQLFYNLGLNIMHYMKYLEEEKLLSEQRKIEKIYFVESDSSSNTKKLSQKLDNHQPTRKNTEMSIQDRTQILDSYSPSDEFEAIAKNAESTYYVKVFKTKDKCKLLMEPKEGTKYTKVVHLNSNKFPKPCIKKIVTDSLELSRQEISKVKDITRHCHTSLEEYKKLLDYLIQEKDNGINYGVKKRIDEANKKR